MTKNRYLLFLLTLLFICALGTTSAFALSSETWEDTWTATGYDPYFPFNTIQHFEIKNGGTSDWEVGAKAGSSVLDNANFTLNSGTTYGFSVAHDSSSGDITINIGGANLVYETGESSFNDLWFFTKVQRDKTDTQSALIDNLYVDSAGPYTLDGDWGDGLHLFGESFSGFSITGDLKFNWEGSIGNSEIGAFIGWSNTTSAAVPEPATMLMLGLGLVGLAGIGRSRIKK